MRGIPSDLQSPPHSLQCTPHSRWGAVESSSGAPPSHQPGKTPMKTLRHPPSKELWKFCMERLRELRGPDTRERDLANMLGFEHSRAVRWKEGQMYVDRAEYLVRLA